MHRDTFDDAGIVDEDINLANFFVDFFNEFAHSNLISNVANITFDIGDASLLVVVQATLKGSFVDVVENNGLHACGNECLGNVETDTVGRAGNPGVFAFKRKVFQTCHVDENLMVSGILQNYLVFICRLTIFK